MVSPSGAQFEGWFRDGAPNGDGILTWPDGGKFIGKYVAGKVRGSAWRVVRVLLFFFVTLKLISFLLSGGT